MTTTVVRSAVRRCATLLSILVPSTLPGQSVTRLTLGPASARLAAEFSSLTWARELGDGRVIVTDGRDGRVVVADLRAGTVEQLGRRGQGPGEYPRALPVWSIGADSSVMMDSPQRWLVFDGARIAATLAPETPPVAAARGIARGADAVGHVYSAAFLPGRGRPIGDSTALLRVSRATGRVDTLTKLQALVPRRASAPDRNGYFAFSMPTAAMADETVPFADGWVAVVRSDPYHVEWRSPNGGWTRGPALPFSAIRMDEKEKRAFMERLAAMSGRAPSAPDSIPDWPATIPPYRSPVALLAAPDGRLLIPRLASAHHPETRYDVVNRRGTLDGQLTLPPNERIVGFGATTVYVAVSDDDGIQRLQRHPWALRPVVR